MDRRGKMSEIHRIICGNGNCYIIENGTSGILVDTGRREYRTKVMEACQAYRVKLLVLTHPHFDHADNATAISATLGIPIGMNRRDCNLIQSNNNQQLSAETILGKIVLFASLKDFSSRLMPEFQPDILLDEGDRLTDYGISATILSLPGHTDGSIGIDVEEKNLIVGDALMNMFYPTVSLLFHSKRDMLESARKISKLGNRTIYFGHGKPVTNRQWVK